MEGNPWKKKTCQEEGPLKGKTETMEKHISVKDREHWIYRIDIM